MDFLQLMIVLTLAGLCGAFAELIVGFGARGLAGILVAVIIGILGAFLGSTIANLIQLPSPLIIRITTVRIDIIWAVVGAVLILLVLRGVRGGSRRPAQPDEQPIV